MRARRRRAGHFGREALEQRFQQMRVEQMLRLGKGAGAGGRGADFLLHAPKFAGGADGVEGFDGGVDQRKEEQRKIIELLEPAFGITPGGMLRRGFKERGQTGAEIIEQFPLAQIVLGQFGRGTGHAASAAKPQQKYK